MVVKRYLEPILEPAFHEDSYGYRPGKSAHDALAVARRRCWDRDWVLDLDIKSFFDEIDWELLMRAVRRHTDCKWVLLYLERWLKAPVSMPDGTLVGRERGTPQRAVVSPVLANLFLHYAFDRWMRREYPDVRSRDMPTTLSAIVEAKPRRSRYVRRWNRGVRSVGCDCTRKRPRSFTARMQIVLENTQIGHSIFLGYTLRPRVAKNRDGKRFVGFLPAVSKKAGKRMRQSVRRWRLHCRNDLALADIAKWVRPVLTGWVRYYGRFYPSKLREELRTIEAFIVRWAGRKYKRFERHVLATWDWLRTLKRRNPNLFAHWALRPTVG
jgi:group II intron reverse transcriptase/maturase